jgi:hypothetical protein
LSQAFAQYQAAGSVVELDTQIARNREALDGYAENLWSEHGDVADYWALRRELSGLERAGSRSRRDRRRDAVTDVLDRLADGRDVHALITIGYHVRSAEPLCERYGGQLWGPANCASRLRDSSRLRTLEPGSDGPGGATAFAIGRPVRAERPLWLPSHAAVAFGDAIVTTPEGELRIWAQQEIDEKRRHFYRERFAPTFAPLLELPIRRVLVTHGVPVLEDGAAALRGALEAEPWNLRPRAAAAG